MGAVSDFPTEKKARAEAARLGLIEQINRTSIPVNKITFGFLARDYMRINLADDAIKPNASTTRYTERLIINKHLLPRWEDVPAIEMKALAIEQWLKGVSVDAQGRTGRNGNPCPNGVEWLVTFFSMVRNMTSSPSRATPRRR